jgi:hypothetical protein
MITLSRRRRRRVIFTHVNGDSRLDDLHEDHTPIPVLVVRLKNSHVSETMEQMLEFILHKDMIVSQKSFTRFTPRNETIRPLKLCSRFMNDQFIRGRRRRMFTCHVTLFAHVMALLVLDVLFFRPDSDQCLTTRSEQTNDFFQGQQSSTLAKILFEGERRRFDSLRC